MFHPWPDDQSRIFLAILVMGNAEPLGVDIINMPVELFCFGNATEEYVLDPYVDFEWGGLLTPAGRGIFVTSLPGPAMRVECQATGFAINEVFHTCAMSTATTST
jgi:hypothetical protein